MTFQWKDLPVDRKMLIIHCGAQAQALDGGEIEAGEVLCLMAVWEKWK